jgi:lipoic acid synthetase
VSSDETTPEATRKHQTRSRANPGGMDVLTVLGSDVRPWRERKPAWFKVPAPGGERYRELDRLIKSENLNTVCQEANCPNVGECWERGTATFMILGETCTRRCGFCNVQTGKPTWNDPLEPGRVARSIARMGLRHAVITSVDRDDLPDFGGGIGAHTIRAVRRAARRTKVEVLTPDFRGQEMPLAKVIAAQPDVFNHNVEVVPRLYSIARRGSTWERSKRVLANAKAMGGDRVSTKSGLMVGFGETHDEVVDALGELREKGVQIITIGQYLRPTERHLPVVRYWEPEEFDAVAAAGYALGFDHIAAGPLVRSSYHADQHVAQDEPGIGPVASSPYSPDAIASSSPAARNVAATA